MRSSSLRLRNFSKDKAFGFLPNRVVPFGNTTEIFNLGRARWQAVLIRAGERQLPTQCAARDGHIDLPDLTGFRRERRSSWLLGA